MIMDLNRWKIFRELDPSLKSKCKFAKCNRSPRVGLIVLQDDDVYIAFMRKDARKRAHENHPEGAGAGLQVLKVESLCGKGIIDYYEHNHGFEALSKAGCVYSWHCLQDNESESNVIKARPLLFPSDLGAQRVCQVSSGFDHNLCLSSNGEVFGWGSNQEGQLGSGGSGLEYERDAIKITGLGDNMVQVAAGAFASFTLDSVGRVWSWGSNTNFTLGNDDSRYSTSTRTPRIIENLYNIRKIAAGDSHVLALSEIGELYFWGRFGPTTTSTATPTRITIQSMKPVTDIACAEMANYAVFQTKGTVYFWGIWYGSNISVPKATHFTSMDEVFVSAESPTMLRPIAVNVQPRGVAETWKRAFDDSSTSDIVFSVDSEQLDAHASFLKLRSEYFKKMLDSDWEESRRGGSPIEIKGFSFQVFKGFVYFLYHDSLISDTMTVEDLAELIRAADYYGNDDLRLACENKLSSLLTLENACGVYTRAMQSNAQNLQDYVAEFIAPVFDQVVKSADFARMDNGCRTKLMIQLADLNVFQVPKKRRLQ